MKIRSRSTWEGSVAYNTLSDFKIGDTVTLEKRLNQSSRRGDPYLIVDLQNYKLYTGQEFKPQICTSYRKVPVVNLRTNMFSYIAGNRVCERSNAILEID